MAVLVEYTGNPQFPWRVESLCKSKAEAFEKASRAEDVVAAAFLPSPPAATHHATEAPMPPAIAEMIERAESDDPQVGSLKAGEAE